VSQALQTANTTNKCRPGAHRAPINKLGIDYHQYCSSSDVAASTSSSESVLNNRISQEFLQRVEGHYVLICREQHY